MRADDIAPRTWLLAALTGWAVIGLVLALAGMGGRVLPLDDDPTLIQSLPATQAAVPERLGPYSQYGEIAQRPLFFDDRRPKPFSLGGQGEGEQENAFDYVLTSVIMAPSLRMAMLQPKGDAQASTIRVKLGEAPEQAASWRLISLDARQAVFEGPDGARTLELRAYDGTGGAPATPAARPVTGVTRQGNAAVPVPPPTPSTDTVARSAPGAASTVKPAPPTPAPNPATQAPGAGPTVVTPEEQVESIRKRIQARREQLRREQQQQTPATNNP